MTAWLPCWRNEQAMSTRPKDYMLTEETTVKTFNGDKVLPKYAFVKPMDPYHVPKFIKERDSWYHLEGTYVYCYTHWGIVSLPKALVREA